MQSLSGRLRPSSLPDSGKPKKVLLGDRAAIVDLVTVVLGPLRDARGGGESLLDTLAAYDDTGGNAAEAARSMHLSVRALIYRLRRIHELTGPFAVTACRGN